MILNKGACENQEKLEREKKNEFNHDKSKYYAGILE